MGFEVVGRREIGGEREIGEVVEYRGGKGNKGNWGRGRIGEIGGVRYKGVVCDS